MDKHEDSASFTGASSNYYDLPPNCDTVQDLIEAYDMDFTRGNILKAVIRWEVKGLAYNLEKIRWFASDKLRRMRDARDGHKMGADLPKKESDVSGFGPYEI